VSDDAPIVAGLQPGVLGAGPMGGRVLNVDGPKTLIWRTFRPVNRDEEIPAA